MAELNLASPAVQGRHSLADQAGRPARNLYTIFIRPLPAFTFSLYAIGHHTLEEPAAPASRDGGRKYAAWSGGRYAGFLVSCRDGDLLCGIDRLHARLREALDRLRSAAANSCRAVTEAIAMEIWLAGIATIGLTFYLLFALVRPERF